MPTPLPLVLSLTVLLGSFVSAINGQVLSIDSVFCRPQLSSLSLIGRITSSTFALEAPCCLFNNPAIDQTATVWLIVAFSNGTVLFNSSLNAGNIPSYQTLLYNLYYMTLGIPINSLICVDPFSGIRVLRVGNDILCINNLAIPYCNGPLPLPGPYRVKFIVIGRNGTIIAETLWSDDILLRKPQNYLDIDTELKHHSASMISITVILPVLVVLLFASCSVFFLLHCCDSCPRKTRCTSEQDLN